MADMNIVPDTGDTLTIGSAAKPVAGVVTSGTVADAGGNEATPLEMQTAYDHSQLTGNPHGTTAADVGAVAETPNHVTFDTTPTAVPTSEGTVSWNEVDHTLNVQTEIAGVILQVGQENLVRVVNKTGAPIANGAVVYVSGAQGNRPTVALADADNTTADKVLGVATAAIADDEEGYINVGGLVRGYDTAGFTAGDLLYVSSTAGELTKTAPAAPKHAVTVGVALNSTNNGTILVAPKHGADLSACHDVSLASLADLDILQYEAATTLWKNVVRPFIILHGFENQTDSTIAMSGADVQFTGTFNIFLNGKKFTKTGTQAVTITADQSLTFVYFDSAGAIQKSTSPWSITDRTVIPAALVYKDGSNYVLWDERHSAERASLPFHDYLHKTVGARYQSGLTGTFDNTTLSVTQGVIRDEDVSGGPSGTATTCNLWYRNSGLTAMRLENASSTPYKAAAGVIQYDSAGTLTNATNNRYVNYWVYASAACGSCLPIQVVVGQAQHQTVTLARAEALPSILLNTAEWKLIYRVTYQNVGGTATYIEAADLRTTSTGPAQSPISPTSHNGLTDRDAADSHPATAIGAGKLTLTGTTTDGSTDIIQGLDSAAVEQFAVDTNGGLSCKTIFLDGLIGGGSYLLDVYHASDFGSGVRIRAGTASFDMDVLNCADVFGTSRFYVRDNGFVGVGTTSKPATADRLVVKATTADGTTDPFVVQDSGGVEILAVDSDGNIDLAGTLPLSDVSITGATADTDPDDTDEAPIYSADASANRKITLANLKTYFQTGVASTPPPLRVTFGGETGAAIVAASVPVVYARIPTACTISKVTLLADQSGSIVIDVWKDTYANYPPTVADTITASAKPTLSSATKSEDSTLTGWTKSVGAGDVLGFKVDSATTVTRVDLLLEFS